MTAANKENCSRKACVHDEAGENTDSMRKGHLMIFLKRNSTSPV